MGIASKNGMNKIEQWALELSELGADYSECCEIIRSRLRCNLTDHQRKQIYAICQPDPAGWRNAESCNPTDKRKENYQ